MKLHINNGVYRFCARMLVLLAAVSVFWLASPNNAFAEMRVTAGVERYSWGEYSGGGKLLDESGPRFALGLEWLMEGRSGLLFGYNGRLYYNDVTYNGRDSNGTAFSTTTNYQGMLNEGVLHYRVDADIKPEDTDRHYLDLVAGLGLDYWVRDIKGDGVVTGYKETYTIGFLRAGLAMLPVKSGLEVAAGLKYPLYLNEKAGFQSAGLADADLVLTPKPDVSYYGSLGWRFNNGLSVTFDFDSYRFKESDPVSYTLGGVAAGSKVQPESRMEVYTFKVGYSF
ncbi:MAG: hypothetical protein EPO63_09575 [Candidatus Nitrosotenuis sp.]|nr:MAG: hypothetical protein EPO63_09575 [Candidatus Nitrosotenuis sp.]